VQALPLQAAPSHIEEPLIVIDEQTAKGHVRTMEDTETIRIDASRYFRSTRYCR
jgi:hypothetical protein